MGTVNERVTVGDEKVSVTVTRKTKDDLLVSQHSSERWFSSGLAADAATERLMGVFVASETKLITDGEDEMRERRERRDLHEAGNGE